MRGGRSPALLLVLLLAASAALAAAGCGLAERSASDNHGYGWEYDAVGPIGLRLRYEPAVAQASEASLEVFERTFAEVERCTGVSATGPLVVVVRRGTLDDGSGVTPSPGAHVGGLYYFDTDLVVVTETLYALRHEFVHYLLDQSGFPEAANRDHHHPAFTDCVGPAASAAPAGQTARSAAARRTSAATSVRNTGSSVSGVSLGLW